MTAVSFLHALAKFIDSRVAAQLWLQAEEADGEPVRRVHPYVATMFLPHKNFSPNDYQVPFILVGLDSGIDGAQESSLNIRITFATYGGGYYPDSRGNPTNLPDSKGYIDLLNVIEMTKQALCAQGVIGGAGTVEKPFTYGVYDTELSWAYWYGYLTFSANIPATEYVFKESEDKL